MLNLKRDYVALGLTFILPIIFFSIFAMIFGSMSSGPGSGPSALRVIVVDEDGSEVSERFVGGIAGQDALTVIRAPRATEENPEPAPYDREAARLRVRTGRNPVAIIIPAGFGETFGSFIVGVDSVIGPIYTGATLAEGGDWSGFLFVGTPFGARRD